MKDRNIRLGGKKVYLRLIQPADKELYYAVGFENADEEASYLTGTTASFTKEATDKYIDRIVDDESRYDFLIFSPGHQLLGEVVLNEIDYDSRQAGFRICLFRSDWFNQGIGSEAARLVLELAFGGLRLHRIELEVYDYNPRARHVYEKLGFVQEGVKRDGVFIRNCYHDVILMSMLEADYASSLGTAVRPATHRVD